MQKTTGNIFWVLYAFCIKITESRDYINIFKQIPLLYLFYYSRIDKIKGENPPLYPKQNLPLLNHLWILCMIDLYRALEIVDVNMISLELMGCSIHPSVLDLV